MKVEVRPLDIPKWHGKTEKESFKQPVVIEALYNPNTGRYATGMTEEEQEKYGKLLKMDLSDNFNQEEPHPFYGSAAGRVKLFNNTMIFDTTIPLNFVKVQIMKASDDVANSMKEWEAGLWPDATHVITDEAEEMAQKATGIEKKYEAMELAKNLSPEAKISVIQILGGKSMRQQSPNFILAELDELITNKQEEFLKVAKLDNAELSIRAQVLEAEYRNILTKEGTSYYYMSDKIGFDFEDTVAYFQDPQNQNMKIAILEKLKK